MSVAYESDTDLAFDTRVLKLAANEYGECAKDLRDNASALKELLDNLHENGWTTGAGRAFYRAFTDDWAVELGKYADLLETLQEILNQSAITYDTLVDTNINTIKVNA